MVGHGAVSYSGMPGVREAGQVEVQRLWFSWHLLPARTSAEPQRPPRERFACKQPKLVPRGPVPKMKSWKVCREDLVEAGNPPALTCLGSQLVLEEAALCRRLKVTALPSW